MESANTKDLENSCVFFMYKNIAGWANTQDQQLDKHAQEFSKCM